MRNEEIAKKKMLKVIKEFLIKDDALFKSNLKNKRIESDKLFAEMEEKFEKIRKKYGVNLVLYMRDAKEGREELIKQGLLK